jgi:DNA invertase Pin-like site-specific DNA recombinase
MAISSLPVRCVLYARISTTNGQDPQCQLRDLRTFAQARGFTVQQEFVDVGISGAKDSRPALNALMEAARKRKFDAVLVARFDRFARSTAHLLRALEEFRSLGIQFISYAENIDTTTPLGQALFTIVAAVATLERDLIRERVAAGLRNARAKGKRLGRPRADVDLALLTARRQEGASWRQLAAEFHVDAATLLRTSRRCEIPAETAAAND